MAHRISIQKGKAEFAYTGQDPWHGLGDKVDSHMTPADAVRRIIPWTVSLRELAYVGYDGSMVKSTSNRRIIARDDNNVELGIATKSYFPVQNHQNAEIADALVAEGAECVETIGALDDGARCFMLLNLDRSGFEAKRGDKVVPYFLLKWGHDGRTPVEGRVVFTRVVCHNTLGAAEGECEAGFKFKHQASASVRIEEAREALSLARKVVAETAEAYAAMAQAALAPQQAVDYFQGVFPAPANVNEVTVDKAMAERLERWNAVQAQLLALYSGAGKGSLQAGPTAWGAYNAVTEYLDHIYPVLANGKVSRERQQSVLFGAYADTRALALDNALALVK